MHNLTRVKRIQSSTLLPFLGKRRGVFAHGEDCFAEQVLYRDRLRAGAAQTLATRLVLDLRHHANFLL